jgi:acyl-ACP thioesterase
MTSYFVVDDQMLCYQNTTYRDYQPNQMNVLHNKDLSYGTPLRIYTEGRTIRPATKEDFKEHRIHMPCE